MHEPARRSQFAQVGEILLLVATILHGVGAIFFVLLFVFMGALLAAGVAEVVIVMAVYGVVGVLVIAGFFVSLSALNAARDGKLHTAGIRGIVAAMLPPVGVLPLLGGIFAFVSDEAKMEERGEYVDPTVPRIDTMVIRED